MQSVQQVLSELATSVHRITMLATGMGLFMIFLAFVRPTGGVAALTRKAIRCAATDFRPGVA